MAVGSAAGSSSWRSALKKLNASPIITNANGAPATIAACCSVSSPPASSSVIATPPIAVPQNATIARGGSRIPRHVSMPITIDAASAPLTKNTATSTITTTEVMRGERELLEQREQRDLRLGDRVDQVGLRR